MIGEAADDLVDYFLFSGDSRVDEVFESGRVRGDSVKFHGDTFSSSYLQFSTKARWWMSPSSWSLTAR